MELSKQVCSLKLAKKLKKLGVKQESYFLHILDNNEWEIENKYIWEKIEGEWGYGREIKDLERCSAFTVAELGEIMKEKGLGTTAHSDISTGGWWVRGGIWNVGNQQYEGFEEDKIWANALAKMLVYLLENKLLGELRGEGKCQ